MIFFRQTTDVPRWLARAGWPVGKIAEKYQHEEFLELARSLRDAIRSAVEKRKAGEPISGMMNLFLYDAHSHLQLIPDNKGGVAYGTTMECNDP